METEKGTAPAARGQRADTLLATLCSKMLAGDFAAAQLWFDQQVLDRYRAQEGARIIRTNSAGRVRSSGGWSLDFGIAGDDQLIHASVADVAQRVPPGEQKHWTAFLVALPTSKNFLIARLGGMACIDDGDVRDWPGAGNAIGS